VQCCPPHLGFLYTAPNPLEQPPLVAGAVDVVVVTCSTAAVVEATAEHQPSYVDNIMNLGLCVTRGFRYVWGLYVHGKMIGVLALGDS